MTPDLRWRVVTLQIVLVVVLAFVAGFLDWAASFTHSYVHDELVAQKIAFPPAGSRAITSLPASDAQAMKQYAGQPLDNGDQAQTYANHFIAVHPEARGFVDRNRQQLAAVPVWLFSSGPVGQDDPQPHGDPAHLDEVMQTTRARGHRIFVGKLDKSELGLGERLAAKMVKAPEGDFRDWEAIRAWADEIATALQNAAS